MKRFLWQGIVIIIAMLIIRSSAFAAGVSIWLYPASGVAEVNKEFAVDIKVNTGGSETVSTRAVILFDPNLVHVSKVETADLYCDYPSDKENYGVSNTDGYVVITGFCNTDYVNTSDGLLARVYFMPQKEGDLQLEFQFNGNDSPGQTVILENGSPPTNVLTEDPIGGAYKIVQDINSYNNGMPATGVASNLILLAGILGFIGIVGYKVYKRHVLS